MEKRLAEYGARMEGDVLEMRDPNDNAHKIFQYRRSGTGIERRVLQSDGTEFIDGSPWEEIPPNEIRMMAAQRGSFHPILDTLGL